MKMICLFFTLILLNLAKGDQQCFLPGECLESVTLKSLHTTNEVTCLHACRNYPRCNWFTYAPKSSLCVLLVNCGRLSNDYCEDCISGEMHCHICWVTGQCQGGLLIHVTEATDKFHCQNKCQTFTEVNQENTQSSCYWFTHNAEYGDCSLYYDCPTLDETCENCVSAEKNCHADVSSTTPKTTTTTELITTTPIPPTSRL